ncbi:glycine cleavage system protein GcvH [Vagococcus elongatus]|uniref:Glycine cleavage system H protein n=1 Tax=Vagococcus elongatus TaxID=180344 RepID=A0A430AX60_9ENTE|nr:glycine cleavage system protein GcvH [Vagococcus elongatus]RSU12650.1 glycine cleavage system protein H [Vagococcus elongatus]
MKNPENLKYSKSHEWFKELTETSGQVGLTFFAQEELGDIVYLTLPEEGDEVAQGDVVCDIESVKAVSDIHSPVSGTITKVNEALLDSPELVNEAPFDTWLFEIEEITAKDDLLNAEEYTKFVEEEA